MIKFVNHPAIGYGIYSVSDAASLLRLPVGKVRYWLNRFWDERLAQEPGLRHSWGEGREKAVNFYTLIEFYIFYQLRAEGFSVSKILRAHQFLSKEFKVAYPFASFKIMAASKSILFSPDEGESIVEAKAGLQHTIPGIINDFLKKLDFEDGSQLAERFYPDGRESSVVVDPQHRFGQPVIFGTNISAVSLYSLHLGGESDEFIASLYGLNPKQVRDAVAFYRKAA